MAAPVRGSPRYTEVFVRRLAGGLVAALLCMPVAVVAVFTGTTAAPPGAPSERALAEIPADLLTVYRAAAVTCPGLPWSVLAAVGWVESRHAGGRADPHSGAVQPPIVGPALDGRAGTAAIRDPSQPDGRARALGPMQFLPATWQSWSVLAPDRPPGADPDPHNAWDAIYTAGRFLCGGREQLEDLNGALRRYNRSGAYVNEVRAKAAEYRAGSSADTGGGTVPGSVSAAIAAAMTQLGVPYQWGGQTPGVGFDCSGLVQWAFAEAGVQLPRTTAGQILAGVPVERVEDLQPGDLLFTTSVRDGEHVIAGHVAIYIGGGYVVVAPRTGDVVKLRPVTRDLDAIRRVVGRAPSAAGPSVTAIGIGS